MLIKRVIYQDDITIINLCVSNCRVSKYKEEQLSKQQGVTDKICDHDKILILISQKWIEQVPKE